MAIVLTVVFVFLMGIFVLLRIRAAHREAAERDRREEEAREKRKEMEKELLERVGRLKERDDLQIAKDAIHRDPKRAAKVLSRMMRK